MKIIVVVGGVISGVGKGIATASIGKILQEYGYSVTAVKIDQYINVDPGTMRPTEHGEVWVTDDGGEIDQDLGNYERFLGYEIPKKNAITTGQIYKYLIEKERNGQFLGKTVEVIPHFPNEVKRRIKEAARRTDAHGVSDGSYDFVIVEIGGTLGEYQNLPYLFAAKSLELELGKENVVYVLVSYLPVPHNIGEMKTKPTQLAIKLLNEAGIFPDFVLCRGHQRMDEVRRQKLEQNANIPTGCVFSAPDVKTIYRVPLNFEAENFGKKILERFNLQKKKEPEWGKWREVVEIIENPERTLKIGMIGKYIDIGNFALTDSYISVNEALKHAGAQIGVGIEIEWIDAKKLEKEGADSLRAYSGIIVPGGFGSSGVEGKILAIKYARENNLPFLGLCYGLQMAVIEYSRSVCNMTGAHTTEVEPKTKYPVIDILPAQKALMEKNEYGGTMRLGAYAAEIKQGTKVFDLYKKTGRINRDSERIKQINEEFRLGNNEGTLVLERHRHRYEVNPEFIKKLEQSGLVFSGFHRRHDDTELMEFCELPNHPFFVATQAHPEFKSNPEEPSPLFLGFVEACSKK